MIKAGLGKRMHVSLQGDTNALIDWSRDARAGRRLRQGKAASKSSD